MSLRISYLGRVAALFADIIIMMWPLSQSHGDTFFLSHKITSFTFLSVFSLTKK